MNVKSAIMGGIMMLSAMLPLQAAQAADAGTMRYNSSAGKMEFFDGSQWYFFGTGLTLGACSAAGAMDYNSLLGAYQVCDGSNWTQVAASLTLNTCLFSPGTIDYRNSTFMVCNGVLWLDMKGAVVTS